MNEIINSLCEQLSSISDEYSDCGRCGKVIKDSSLLVPDRLNPRLFRSKCPSCGADGARYPFPPSELKSVFEMIIESTERNRPIFVLVLSCTVYEALVEDFFVRLLEKHNTNPDIGGPIVDKTNNRQKMEIIRGITGKKPKDLAKLAGYDNLMGTLEEIKKKRNAFLHKGVTKKRVIEPLKEGVPLYTARHIELDDKDISQALQFTIDTVNFFAQLYSDYGTQLPLVEPDY